MENTNTCPSNQKIVGPERLEEKRRQKKIREANEKISRAIEAIVRYSESLD